MSPLKLIPYGIRQSFLLLASFPGKIYLLLKIINPVFLWRRARKHPYDEEGIKEIEAAYREAEKRSRELTGKSAQEEPDEEPDRKGTAWLITEEAREKNLKIIIFFQRVLLFGLVLGPLVLAYLLNSAFSDPDGRFSVSLILFNWVISFCGILLPLYLRTCVGRLQLEKKRLVKLSEVFHEQKWF